MPSLQERLGSILRDVLTVEDEPDGGLTVHHDGTFASLRVVNIAEDSTWCRSPRSWRGICH